MDTSGKSVKLESVIRVRRTDLGVCTLWTLDRFREKLTAMRQLYQKALEKSGNDDNDEDWDEDGLFCDPNDAWMNDSPAIFHSSQLLSPHL